MLRVRTVRFLSFELDVYVGSSFECQSAVCVPGQKDIRDWCCTVLVDSPYLSRPSDYLLQLLVSVYVCVKCDWSS